MSAAASPSVVRAQTTITDHARQMATVPALRDTWLERGLSTHPSDRPTAQDAVCELYRLAGFREPEFVWVPSPPAGAKYIASNGLSSNSGLGGGGFDSALARIASLITRSRARMDRRIPKRTHGYYFDDRPLWVARAQSPPDAAALGVNADLILRAAAWDSLRISLFDGVAAAIRPLVPSASGSVTWYGQQEAHRIAYYDLHRHLGLTPFRSEDHDVLDTLTMLAGATGWWWAFDHVCVMAERPRSLHTEPLPGGVHNERRLHRQDNPAIEFGDGRTVYVDHGTVVPEWVVREPTVERIARERNVEVRRCAIERIGWDTYIDEAGLALVDRTDDPGNPGATLSLYATNDTPQAFGRILLVTNGSAERDGQRRRYGLPVPDGMSSALGAAGWTYGITGDDYAQLLRRT